MITPKDNPPREALERIASDYRERGYQVLVEPRGQELPPFLKDATPDIIARRHSESLVIEVKNSPKDVDPAELHRLSELISKQPGWHFVVIATQRDPVPDQTELTDLDEQHVHTRLREVRELVASKHVDAALMLAWSAVETSLRLLAQRHRIRIKRYDTASLIRGLATDGLIDDAAFRQLNEAMSLRSRIAHGHGTVASQNEGRAAAESLLGLAERLLGDLHAPA